MKSEELVFFFQSFFFFFFIWFLSLSPLIFIGFFKHVFCVLEAAVLSLKNVPLN